MNNGHIAYEKGLDGSIFSIGKSNLSKVVVDGSEKNTPSTTTKPNTQLIDFGDQDYVVKVAWTLEEACKLLEAGFQYVCDYDKSKIFKKPK